MTQRCAVVLVLVLAGGCFRAPSDAVRAGDHASPKTLLVSDPAGASFSASSAPRDPLLDLAFADSVASDAEQRVLLLRGVVAPALAAQLSGGRPAGTQKARTIALRTERRGRVLRAQPLVSLTPGAHYSLIWQSEPTQVFVLQVAAGPSFGARLIESAPGAGQAGVPAQLTRALLRFDGAVQGDLPAHLALQTARGEAVAAQVTVEPCTAHGLPAGDCAWLYPSAPLVPGGGYQLALSGGLSAATGAPIDAAVAAFEVAQQADDAPPRWLVTPCARDELASADVCSRTDDSTLYVHGSVSTSALVELSISTASQARVTATLSYASTFALQLPYAGDAHTALLRATDLAGRTSERTLSFTLADDLAQIAIDEVRADPLGKEPSQEYVELLNFGPTPVSLMGFMLTKDVRERGRALVSALTLRPGERALAVSPDFDTRDDADGTLPAGTQLIALDGSLSLANAGETVFLHDPRGRRVSAARALAALVEGQCSARLAGDMRSGDESLFELDPAGGCTPASASFRDERDAGGERSSTAQP